MKYLYLTIELLALALPLCASFNKNAPFYKKWKYFGVALTITTIFFLIWDWIFIDLEVWGFNPGYISGIFIGPLPIEEILFFICIPYASVFTYFTMNHLVQKDHLFPHQELITGALILLLMISGVYNIDKLYTSVTFLLLALFLAYQMLKLRPRYMGRFYLAYAFLLIPFFIVDSVLTGSFIKDEVVWYTEAQTLGMRIGTIPLEDFFYAMLLILMNITIMEWYEEWEYYKKK
ncbi:MAG: lycopene cyclase domain-containing protein [Chryseolinea sp.]